MKLKKVLLALLPFTLLGCTPKVPEPTPAKEQLDVNSDIVKQLMAPFDVFGDDISIRGHIEQGWKEDSGELNWKYWYNSGNVLGYDAVDENMKFMTAYYASKSYQNKDVTVYASYDEINQKVNEIFGCDLDIAHLEKEGTDLYYESSDARIKYDDMAKQFMFTKAAHGYGDRYYKTKIVDAIHDTAKEDMIQIKVAVMWYEDNIADPNCAGYIYADPDYKELLANFDYDDTILYEVKLDDYLDQLRCYQWNFIKKDQDGPYVFDSVEFLKDEFKGGELDYYKKTELKEDSRIVTSLLTPFINFGHYDVMEQLGEADENSTRNNYTYFYSSPENFVGYDVVNENIKFIMGYINGPYDRLEKENQKKFTVSEINESVNRIFGCDIDMRQVERDDGTRLKYCSYLGPIYYDDVTDTLQVEGVGHGSENKDIELKVISAIKEDVIIEGRRREDVVTIQVKAAFVQGNEFGAEAGNIIYSDPSFTTQVGKYSLFEDLPWNQVEEKLPTYTYKFIRKQKTGGFYFDSVSLEK